MPHVLCYGLQTDHPVGAAKRIHQGQTALFGETSFHIHSCILLFPCFKFRAFSLLMGKWCPLNKYVYDTHLQVIILYKPHLIAIFFHFLVYKYEFHVFLFTRKCLLILLVFWGMRKIKIFSSFIWSTLRWLKFVFNKIVNGCILTLWHANYWLIYYFFLGFCAKFEFIKFLLYFYLNI